MLVTLIELALPLAIFLTAGCIDVNLAREKLLPEEKVTVYYTTEKLAEMEYNFTGVEQIAKVAHFKVFDGTPWIELRYAVKLDELPAGSPLSSVERHFTIRLISDVTGEKVVEYTDYVDKTFTKDPPLVIMNPREGIWSVEVEMNGVYYSGPGGEVQDSFFVYVSGRVPHRTVERG